ncbi:hypothetical protein PV405_34900 [Streptomyces sp. ME02-6979-3A]|uniref:hypothetical protein n=1 Tax=Streptomyces sp. ME02-6979-3A TaxID=3028673 RepID=UPI0029B5CDEA|nr:hypothetical protein [Streptomyces sp. ME02-6979-3A]MDX3329779.1 hypothetical protein [Streptomyces sp. ME02-6979-3A]
MGLFSNKTFTQELEDAKRVVASETQYRIEDEACGFKSTAAYHDQQAKEAAKKVAQLEEIQSYRARD